MVLEAFLIHKQQRYLQQESDLQTQSLNINIKIFNTAPSITVEVDHMFGYVCILSPAAEYHLHECGPNQKVRICQMLDIPKGVK